MEAGGRQELSAVIRGVVLGAAGRGCKQEWVVEFRHPLVVELTGANGIAGYGCVRERSQLLGPHW